MPTLVEPREFPAPEPGDIVWCRFPEELGAPGPKPRPCLVIQLLKNETGGVFVKVAFGTSQKTMVLYTGEFAIYETDGSAFEASGLDRVTKFDLGAQVVLPYDEVWFSVPNMPEFGQTPKLGVLHASLMKRATAAMSAVATSRSKKR